ncbi:MAG TPA: glycoside hydrolase family 48 protein [Planctomycetota bacterium]
MSLIDRYLDGIATPEEIAELDRRLAADPAFADRFARASRRDQALAVQFQVDAGAARFRAFAPRRRVWIAAAAAAAVLAAFLLRGERVLRGPHVQRWEDGTTITLLDGAEMVVVDDDPKILELRAGELEADVAPQKNPMVLRTPEAEAVVIGTKFRLSTTRLEVREGRVRFAGRDVAAGQVAYVDRIVAVEVDRFLDLYRKIHDPKNGYFSRDGVPYHAVETLIVDAPDHGHLTTSETFSYWLWLEAAYGRITGDWAPYRKAWAKMEEVAIPTAADQPSLGFYNPEKPMTPMRDAARIEDYPVGEDGSKAEADPLRARELYVMHWLIDADNVYGFGRRGDCAARNGFVNTFQRGPDESVWETIPHPSWDPGPSHVGLFVKSDAPQWRYVCAPDAEARAIQAAYWARVWAKPGTPLPDEKRMGDSLRYALHDKRFRGEHGLIGWAFGWGGSIGAKDGWAWRSGASQAHFGYQNPMAAWALKDSPAWARSLEKQLAMYADLQSPEGAIAGGYDIDGAALTFNPHPVFQDPPSNEWFGWQAWSMDRLAQYLLVSKDPRAKPVVERWAAWIKTVVRATPGGYAIPATLAWNGKSVRVTAETQDVGVAGATARALAFWAAAAGDVEARALAKALLDGIWAHRDALGVSNPEERADYARFDQTVPHPKGETTFLKLRPWYARPGARTFRYHRFWAQVEVAVANAEFARLQ